MSDKYFGAREIVKELIGYNLRTGKQFPFNRPIEDITFQWANIIIPKGDIERIIWKSLNNESLTDLDTSIKMLVQIPFCISREQFGTIHINVSLTFRYDKQYKYGDVTKNLPTTCFFIRDNAIRMNDFYLMQSETAIDFLNYYVLQNQYGIGSLEVSSAPREVFSTKDTLYTVDESSNDCAVNEVKGDSL